MKLATTTGDFLKHTKSGCESLKHIADAGFKFADYNFNFDFEHSVGVFGENSEEYIRTLIKTAEEAGITFVQAHSPMGEPITKDEKHEKFISGTKKCIEVCAMLGIKNIVVHSGYEKGLSKEETFERNREFYLDILKVAEKWDVNILTENFNKICVEGYYWIDNVYDMKELIEYVNHPLLGACFDTGHANLQKESMREQISVLSDYIKAIHVHDNMGDGDTHRPLWCGTLDIDSLMEGLIDINYGGYFTFESGCIFPDVPERREMKDRKLSLLPLFVRVESEKLLYKMGEHILREYGMYEE